MELSRPARHRVLTRAARAWEDGKPHAAWEILAEAGLGDLWPEFRRTAFARARARFTAEMNRYRR